MCYSCWVGEGSPDQWNDSIARAVELIRDLHKEEPAGGPLHTVLDDWNLDWDRADMEPLYSSPDIPGFPGSGFPDRFSGEVHAICDELAVILNGMSIEERYSAVAHSERLTERSRGDGLMDTIPHEG